MLHNKSCICYKAGAIVCVHGGLNVVVGSLVQPSIFSLLLYLASPPFFGFFRLRKESVEQVVGWRWAPALVFGPVGVHRAKRLRFSFSNPLKFRDILFRYLPLRRFAERISPASVGENSLFAPACYHSLVFA